MTLAAVRLGIAKSSRKAVIRVIHVNNGIRLIVIPGARILRIVTTKLSEPAIEEIPRRSIPSSQKSSFKPGVHMTALPQFEVSSLTGAKLNQPPLGAWPRRKLEFRKIPAKSTIQ